MPAVAEPPVVTFTRIAEIWRPEGDRLVFQAGTYGTDDAFGALSEGISFAKGEGLPGKAWAEGRPVVLNRLEGSYFQRAEAANDAGLTSAVAVPVFAEATLKAVLVILCGEDRDHHGAIEVWQDAGSKLTLTDGYYGTAHEFAEVSQDMSFGYGQGLPGGTWAANMPILMRDLGRIGAFLRAEAGSVIGLKHGLGVPVPAPDGKSYVLTLLSSAHTPIARRFEIWDARPEKVGATKRAQLIDGICEIEGGLWPKENPPTDIKSIGAWEGPVGQVLGSGLPEVHLGTAGLPAGYHQMVALPVYHETELAYVVAWYL